jgi:hypothetical protein
MPVVSITRLRLRSWKFLPSFIVYAIRSRIQAAKAPGNLAHKAINEPDRVFWTATAWDAEDSVRQFMVAHPHGEAMRRLLNWCDEASVARWTQDTADLPNWQEAHRRMQAEGRPSKVRFPSAAHQQFKIPAPKTKR